MTRRPNASTLLLVAGTAVLWGIILTTVYPFDMKLHRSRVCITLWPMVDSSFACCGEPREFPADMVFRVVKRKRTTVLIRARNAGFAWVNPSDLADCIR